MKTKGIRISDIKEAKCITFSEILSYIKNGQKFYWSILWLDITPLKNEGEYIIQLEKKLTNLKKVY